MHAMTKECKEACDIRNNASAREMAEQLLLAYTPFKKTARMVNKTCRTQYKHEGIAQFYHYFFNVDAIPRSAWADAIKRRPGAINFRSALIGDSDLVLWRMGERVVVDTRTALEEAFTQCYMRLIDMKNMPTSMATIKMTQACVEGLVRSHQALTESEVRMKDMLERLENFRQTRREVAIPDARQLGHISYNDEATKTSIRMLEEPTDVQ